MVGGKVRTGCEKGIHADGLFFLWICRIGEVTFYLIRPIGRCTVPGVNQDSGVKDKWGGPLAYLKETRSFEEKPNDGCFCVDVVPLTSGVIRVGDKVQVLERIPDGKEQKPLVK